MYPRNAASPERIAVGPVILISDGTPQSSGVTVTVRGQGGAEAGSAGTIEYGATGVIVYYTPTQAETNFTSFTVIASKTACIPACVTVVTTASVTPGYAGVDWGKVTNATSTVGLTNTTVGIVTAAAVTSWNGVALGTTNPLPNAVAGASGGLLISGSNAGTTTLGALTVTGATTLSGAVSLGSTLGVTGTTTFAAVNTGAIGTGTITTTGNLSVSGTVGTGAVTLAGLAITNALSVGTTTTLTGAVAATNASNDIRGIALHATQAAYAPSTATALSALTGTIATLDALLTKIKKYFGLALRKDTAIATDSATELTELNVNYGSGAGAYVNTTDALEALRDRGDAAWVTGTTPPTAAVIADAVWDEDATAHQTQGTFGQAIGDPGADSDTIWALANANLDAAVSSRMASYTQPTGFLAATFPSGTIANTTNITAGTLTTVTTATNVTTVNGLAANVITAASVADDAGAELADAVWDEVLSGHLTAGTTGAALNAAGSAGDPWSTALPGAYGAGTAGKIIGDNINATVSSRASQTTLDTLDDFVDTEVAAIKAKTDNLPASPAAVGDIPTAATIADAVWDEDATAHQTQGTFGQAIGDPGADADTIWSLVNANLDAPVSGATAPSAATVASAVWQDTTAGDFTVPASVGKSVMNGVSLGTGLTVNVLTTAPSDSAGVTTLLTRVPGAITISGGIVSSDVKKVNGTTIVGDGSGTPFNV